MHGIYLFACIAGKYTTVCKLLMHGSNREGRCPQCPQFRCLCIFTRYRSRLKTFA